MDAPTSQCPAKTSGHGRRRAQLNVKSAPLGATGRGRGLRHGCELGGGLSASCPWRSSPRVRPGPPGLDCSKARARDARQTLKNRSSRHPAFATRISSNSACVPHRKASETGRGERSTGGIGVQSTHNCCETNRQRDGPPSAESWHPLPRHVPVGLGGSPEAIASARLQSRAARSASGAQAVAKPSSSDVGRSDQWGTASVADAVSPRASAGVR